jgi:hypothetical protein
MKLLEIAPDFVRSQVGTLLTILQHLEATLGTGDSGQMTAKVPMSAIVNLMNNSGNHFSYGAFKQIYDTEPRVQALVSNMNQDEVTIGRPAEITSNDQSIDPTAKVDQMAQKAAQTINQPVQ